MDRLHLLSLTVAAFERLWEKADLSGRFEELLMEISSFTRLRTLQLTELVSKVADVDGRVEHIFYRRGRVMIVSSGPDGRAFVRDVESDKSFEFEISMWVESYYHYDPSIDRLYVSDFDGYLLVLLDLAPELPETTIVPIDNDQIRFSHSKEFMCAGRVFICGLLEDGRIALSLLDIDEKRKCSHLLPLLTSKKAPTCRHLYDFVVSEESSNVFAFTVRAGNDLLHARLRLSGHSCSIEQDESWSAIPVARPLLQCISHICLLAPELMLMVSCPCGAEMVSLVLIEFRDGQWFVVRGDPTLKINIPSHLSIDSGLLFHTAHSYPDEKKMVFSTFRCTWE